MAGFYVCPLCLSAFPATAIDIDPPNLTIEHVPPQNQGGPYLRVLTCRMCNNTAGSELESHLAIRDRLNRAGQPGVKDLRVHLEMDGIPLKAVLGHDASLGSFRILVDGQHNDPAALRRFDEARQAGSLSSKAQFRFIDGFDAGRIRVARLRMAYLVAFAHFGYRYAFTHLLEAVREQIRRPDEEILPGEPFAALLGEDPPFDPDRKIFGFRGGISGICVGINDKLILLPMPGESALALYRAFSEVSEALPIETGGLEDWPQYPEYRADIESK